METQEIIQQCSIALQKAVMQLMRTKDLAFDTNVLLNLPRKFTETDGITMKLEGTELVINPSWFLSRSPSNHQWDLRQLVWHIIGFDAVRVGNKDADTWNTACDLWINNMLTEDSSFKVERPSDAAYMAQLKGWDKDKIYDYLKQNQDKQEEMQQQDPMSGDCCGSEQPQSDGDGEGDNEGNGKGDPQQGEGKSTQEQLEQLEKQMSNMLQQAAMQAKQAGGRVPDSIDAYLDELYNPKLPWNYLLLKYMNSFNTHDYSYQRINKKFFAHNIIMPTMFSEGLGKIAIATDQSCSVSDEDIKLYLGAIEAIHTEMNPERIDIVGFTTQIDSVFHLEQHDDINKIKFRTHGGTYIPCVFDYFMDQVEKPQVLILFSDMYSDMPRQKPPFDVIWISVGNKNFQADFGRTIHIDSK